MKGLWQRLVYRRKRIKAELDHVALELPQSGALKSPPALFPEKPYKASTITLFCVFAFFVLLAFLAVFKK